MKQNFLFKIWILSLSLGVLVLPSRFAFAVVGEAERYDPFKEEDLEEFHKKLLSEEKDEQMLRTESIQESLEKKSKEAAAATSPEVKKAIDEDIEVLKQELLQLPKRDRFRFETDATYQYDTNINRLPINHEKSDSVFQTQELILLDLSGKKADLRNEITGTKQWNVHFSEKDAWLMENKIRYRRKYFKKVTHSFQSSAARESSKTVEIDEKKVRWDFREDNAFNYAFSEKLSMNAELAHAKRVFEQEAFDQDSNWQVLMAPSVFWNFTPKSRVALGYSLGVSRARDESADSNAHEVHANYFGRVTNKSSVSLDVGYSHQSPQSTAGHSIDTVKTGVGYLWQMNAKTQWSVQLLRSVQNTTSNFVSGDVNGSSVTTKNDKDFSNDSISISLNSRLTQKITGVFTATASHVKSKVGGDDDDGYNRNFSFPISIGFTYLMKRWIRFTLNYTFDYRLADEKAEEYRSHLIFAGVHIIV